MSVNAGRGAVMAPQLPLRELGRTGLRVSRLGVGLAGLGRPAYMTLRRDEDLGDDRSMFAMAHRAKAVLDDAYAAGVRYIDVARSYGLAESFVRRWSDARQLPEDAITIGSKWGYAYTGDWQVDAPCHEIKNLTVDTLRRQHAESARILGTRLSLYQIHSATLESGVLYDAAVLSELRRLRARGLRVGLTVTGARQSHVIRRALDVYVDGLPLFQTVQATWNLLETSAARALADAQACGCGVIIKEVLANGRLTSRNDDPNLHQVAIYARMHDTTLESLAVAAALAQPWADVVLSGAVTRAQLQTQLEALALTIDVGALPHVAETPDDYWGRRATLPWT